MTYSCGYRRSQQDSLDQMQDRKHRIISDKLEIEDGARVLDIGCGWGAMLIHLAREHGARVTGITLSQQQCDWANRRLAQEDLTPLASVRCQDYRDVEEQYDRVVSIGMFEHVGRAHWPVYFSRMSELLRPGGVGVLHTIGTVDQRQPEPWLRRHIFPGTYLPWIEDLVGGLRATTLNAIHVENWKPHYAATAEEWSSRFQRNRSRIAALDNRFDVTFLRSWHYYLQMLVASFTFGPLQLYQIVFSHGPKWTARNCLHYKSAAT